MGKVPKLRFEGFTGEWEHCTVSEIASETRGGGTPTTSVDKYWQGDIPWIQSSDLTEGELFGVKPRKFISVAGLNSSATKLVPENSIAIVTRVGVGKLTLMPYSYTTSQDFLSLSKLNSDPYYTVYSLYKMLQSELQAVQGTSIKGMTKADLLSKNLYVPRTMEEQRNVGACLQIIDHNISLYHDKCDALHKAKQFYLQNLFPRKGEKTPRLRFAGFSGEWEEKKFGEWGSFYYGYSCPKWSVTPDATVPCIRYGELYTKFGTKIDRVYSHTNIPAKFLKLSKGTEVLIPRVGEKPMDYNHCAWLSLEGVAIGEMISVFNSEQNPLFSATMFNATLQKEFAIRVEGGSVTNLYYDKLMNIGISFPSLDEQKMIASFLDTLDHLITTQQRKLETLKRLKQFMLQNLFV